jgi:hypothetical protein
MAVLGMRLKVWLIIAVMAVGLMGLGTLADSLSNGGGDRKISVSPLTHKPGHKRPPGCDKVKQKKGYKGKPSKKCRNHNGKPPPGQSEGKGNKKGGKP